MKIILIRRAEDGAAPVRESTMRYNRPTNVPTTP